MNPKEYIEKLNNINELVIIGCGGHSKSVANVTLKNNPRIRLIFVDENALPNEKIFGFDVVKEFDISNYEYFVSFGDLNKRTRYVENLIKKYNKKPISIISNSASIGLESKIGYGSFVGINSYIGPKCLIGDNCLINTNAIIEHDSVICDNSSISPRVVVCGKSIIGKNCFVGAGSTIIDSITICDNTIIGAGATVIDNISLKGIYVGVPAKLKL